MRQIVAIFIIVMCFGGQISAQERDTLFEKMAIPEKSIILPEHTNMQKSSDLLSMPLSKPEFGNAMVQNPTLMMMNFNPNNGWRTETGSLIGFRSMNVFPFGNSPLPFYRQSVWDYYQGVYGIRTYQLNNKLSVGTAGYSDRSFNEYSLKSGIYRQTNYGSSLFVGYKFSDKFSISASFTIRRNGDPFNGNQGMKGGNIFP